MPALKDFRIVDDFYLWEAYQGINNSRTLSQFRIVDNYYLYLAILALVGSITLNTSEQGIISLGTNQATATLLTVNYNRVDTVAPGTGVKPNVTATVGFKQTTQNNDSADDLKYYPFLGNNIIEIGETPLAANIPYVIAAGTQLTVFCYAAGELTII